MSNRKCPHCGKQIEELPFTEHGQKIWNGKQWEKDEGYGEIIYRCIHCGKEMVDHELEEMGVV